LANKSIREWAPWGAEVVASECRTNGIDEIHFVFFFISADGTTFTKAMIEKDICRIVHLT